uniref:Mitochondrial import inner membrane translocase subunit Tim21 n=1 Tax=Sphenodon punctatus TaxID=8508 RepID=A0A8D0G2Z7_SPHPU
MFSVFFMRVLQCSQKLQGSPGKWLLAPHRKVFLRTWVCFKRGPGQGLSFREPVVRTSPFFQGLKQNIWTHEGPLRAEKPKNSSKRVAVPRSQTGGAPSAAQKVKEAGRDFTYLIVVVVGIGVTGGLFYVIFKELFSSSSPSKIYGDALAKCRSHPEVIAVFGEPIKGYGEATRRGRRQHVRYSFTLLYKPQLLYHRDALGP